MRWLERTEQGEESYVVRGQVMVLNADSLGPLHGCCLLFWMKDHEQMGNTD